MDLDTLLNALANPLRRKALQLLPAEREMCLCEMMAVLGAGQSNMSRHMAVLVRAGLVTARRDAQWVRYRRATPLPDWAEAILAGVGAADRSVEAASKTDADIVRSAA